MDVLDADGPGSGEGLFGVDTTPEDAVVHVIPVPWEATASYGRGTRHGPAAVQRASLQVDLEDVDFGDVWRAGIALLPEDPLMGAWSDQAEAPALSVIAADGQDPEAAAWVNAISDRVHSAVEQRALASLDAGRLPVVLGGDHSSPLGLIRASAARHPGLGILHIDAHADLRPAYLGFTTAHASIMHNALAQSGVARLVGVAWRDMGRGEQARIRDEPDRIRAFTDAHLARALSDGVSWRALCEQIVEALPPRVHISLDIDGLDPSLCPHTGTPVPGGLSFRELQVLLSVVSEQRHVVSADLCEVAPGPARPGPRWQGHTEWDANVGARVLYKLIGCAIRSQPRDGC